MQPLASQSGSLATWLSGRQKLHRSRGIAVTEVIIDEVAGNSYVTIKKIKRFYCLSIPLSMVLCRRITAEQALAHEYLAQYADPTDEPVSAPYDQSFEDMDLPVDKWKGRA